MASTVIGPPTIRQMDDEDVRQMLLDNVPSFRQHMDRGAGDLVGDLEEIIEYRLWERVGYSSLSEYARENLSHS